MKVERKGFTLLELLTAIVVLGILSSVMLLSGWETTSTAETTNIISNIQNLRDAILLWYADNSYRVVKDNDNKYKIVTNGTEKEELATFIKNHGSEITRYIENGSSIQLKASDSSVEGDNYCFKALSDGKYWYVGYKFFKDENKKDESFMKKFESRASSLNLLSIKNADNPKAEAEIFGADKDKYVYMLVLKLES